MKYYGFFRYIENEQDTTVEPQLILTNPEEYFKSIDYKVPTNQLDAVVTNLIKLASKDSSLKKEVVGDWGEYVVNICNILATNGKNPEFAAYWKQATTGIESIQESSVMSFREAKGFAKKLGILAALALLSATALSASSLDSTEIASPSMYDQPAIVSVESIPNYLDSQVIELESQDLLDVESSTGALFCNGVVNGDDLSEIDVIDQLTGKVIPEVDKHPDGITSISLDASLVLEDISSGTNSEDNESELKRILTDLSKVAEDSISEEIDSLSESEKANIKIFCRVSVARNSINDWSSLTTEQRRSLFEGQTGIPQEATVDAIIYSVTYTYNGSQLMQNSSHRSYRNRLTENITLPNGIVIKPQESKEEFTGTKSELIDYLKSK